MGLAATARTAAPVAHTRRIELPEGMTVERLFASVVAACLQGIAAERRSLAQAYDANSLHRMRVGLRRLRTALGLFRDVLTLPPSLRRELDWLTATLGQARDWDVLNESILPVLGAAAPDACAALACALQEMLAAQHAAVCAAVGSLRYARLMRGLQRCLQARCWRAGMKASQRRRLNASALKFAQRMLARYRGRLRRRGKCWRKANPAARHLLRIAVKKLRYAYEFFLPLYGAKKTSKRAGKKRARYLAALSALQDELGRLNDAAVAGRLLAELQGGRASPAGCASVLRGYLAARLAHADKPVRKRWRKFWQMPAPDCGR
ncbi:MAG: CHAD domain-containing protein [Burkholderiales bacterium]|nr:CHAD domain-containing protein [Burkholderiales bacterium]